MRVERREGKVGAALHCTSYRFALQEQACPGPGQCARLPHFTSFPVFRQAELNTRQRKLPTEDERV